MLAAPGRHDRLAAAALSTAPHAWLGVLAYLAAMARARVAERNAA